MNNRVNGAGFNGAVGDHAGPNLINVTVPGQGAQQVVDLVGTTAQLRFRQVLLVAPELRDQPRRHPDADAHPSASRAQPSTSPQAESSTTAKATPTPTASAQCVAEPGRIANRVAQPVAERPGARRPSC